MMDTRTKTPPELTFAAKCFSDYYSGHHVGKMPGFREREFGFMFFDRGYVHRHIGFRDEEELSRYLSSKGPSHAYYSTAYYSRPGAGTMAEKGWLGADLIFDLDADHVKGSEALPYEQMLARVKEVMMRLYDEFICTDLGFREEETEIVFSGGRGYHVHVYGENIRKLGSHERREIVDYITASELDLGILLSPKVVEETSKGRPLKSTRLPGLNEGGWYGKSRKSLNMFLEKIMALGREEGVSLLVADGMKKVQALRVYDALSDQHARIGLEEEGILDSMLEREDDLKKFTELLQRKTVDWMGGQTDEPVTSDIHRLIRLPGSLHGKTSLKVVSLTRDELTGFDPLRDAVADFPDETVDVESKSDFVSEPVGGERATVREGINSLPLRTALFLILRRKVTLAGPKGQVAGNR